MHLLKHLLGLDEIDIDKTDTPNPGIFYWGWLLGAFLSFLNLVLVKDKLSIDPIIIPIMVYLFVMYLILGVALIRSFSRIIEMVRTMRKEAVELSFEKEKIKNTPESTMIGSDFFEVIEDNEPPQKLKRG